MISQKRSEWIEVILIIIVMIVITGALIIKSGPNNTTSSLKNPGVVGESYEGYGKYFTKGSVGYAVFKTGSGKVITVMTKPDLVENNTKGYFFVFISHTFQLQSHLEMWEVDENNDLTGLKLINNAPVKEVSVSG